MTVAAAVQRADLAAVAAALGSGLAAVRELTEGTFNAACLLELTDGRRVVVKVAPEPRTPVLTYERGLLATEALCLRTFAARTSVPHRGRRLRLPRAGLGADRADLGRSVRADRDGGGPVRLDAATRARLHLYGAHLALIMVVESVPRGTPAAPRLAGWLTRELDALRA